LQRATIFQFESCKVEPLSKTSDGRRLDWKYPREVFNYYKSAELHTVKRRIPMVVWVTIITPLVVIGLIWFFIDSHYEDGKVVVTKSQREQLAAPGEGVPVPVAESGKPPVKAPSGKTQTPREYIESFSPRIAGLAYTAPVYDEVTRPVEAPVPVACIESASKGCRCWSQQATRLDMPDELCRNIVQKGFFLAFELRSIQEAKRKAEMVQTAPQNSPAPSEPTNWVGRIPPDTPTTLTPYASRSTSVAGPSTNPKFNPSLRGS
jgi:hypothetical protein